MSENQITSADDNVDQIDCLLVPLNDRNLIIPNVTVAEVVPFSHLLTTNSSRDWIIGRLDWRGTLVPAICYELMSGHVAPPPNPDARFIIVNGLNGSAQIPFYAILVQGIPKLMHINEADLQEVDAIKMGMFDDAMVTLEGVGAIIPKIRLLESHLAQHL
jgi:chemosensory pili system protein ChpC|tara:strand:- start:4419 stop:4898 length:480 start_codon:yes stop_codon:yes gene_type:complete